MHSVLVEYHLDTCTGAVTVRHFLVVNNTTIKVILGLLKCKKQSQILLLRQKKKRSKESTSRRSTVHLAAARGTLIPSISVDKTRTGFNHLIMFFLHVNTLIDIHYWLIHSVGWSVDSLCTMGGRFLYD